MSMRVLSAFAVLPRVPGLQFQPRDAIRSTGRNRQSRRPGFLDLLVRLDTKGLTLRKAAGKWSGKVKEMFVVKNAGSHIILKISDTKSFVFPDAKRATYDREGAPLPFSIPLPEEGERLTVIIRDVANGRTGSLTIPIAQIAEGNQ